MNDNTPSKPQLAPVPLPDEEPTISYPDFSEPHQALLETDLGETPTQLHVRQSETLSLENLSEKQISALPHLIGTGSKAQQARDAGIGRATLYRWLQDPDFREALDNIRHETLRAAEVRIQSMAYEAAVVVHEIMRDGSDRVRLQAALATLRLAEETETTRELAERIENVERASSIRIKSQWPGY